MNQPGPVALRENQGLSFVEMTDGYDPEASVLVKAEALLAIMVSRAEGGSGNPDLYKQLRGDLLKNPAIKPMLPSFVESIRDQQHFWSFIKAKYSTYAERREFLWNAFRPLLDHLELGARSPSDASTSQTLAAFDPDHITQIWTRALDRRDSDPEGAITLARTLIESVCKYVLDDLSVMYDSKEDLPKLYKLTAESLNLAPSQHTEQVFKQILGGCQSIVECLGTLRNRISDAHGQGRQPVKPAPHHAELAVNLAGAMATFLVATWRKRKGI